MNLFLLSFSTGVLLSAKVEIFAQDFFPITIKLNNTHFHSIEVGHLLDVATRRQAYIN